jgi:uncharacterized membrane protein YgdD (TMEM256/DUF423 family)
MARQFVMMGSILAFLGVALGAFGAHALQKLLVANGNVEVYKTAVQYQMIHALALLLLASLSEKTLAPARLQLIGGLFIAGIVVFSGSLYLLAISDVKILGAITPLGGLCFLAGWTLLAVVASSKSPDPLP